MYHRATYSPEDNKIRIYPSCRLPADEYERVKAAGFKWAPKQQLFVAPAWTPDREDIALEMCGGEIEDEDTSLVDRAEAKAERLEDLSDRRRDEANRAHAAVESICDKIPMGQPILVGHHSERRARKDAERIQNGMRKAVRCFEQSEYWKQRAAGAIHAAKYKELPAVRHRRIKGLESDLRKTQKTKADAETRRDFWAANPTREAAIQFCNYHDHSSYCFTLDKYPRNPPASQYEGAMSLWSALGGSDGADHAVITVEQAAALALRGSERTIENCERWIAHYENRLTYERAMLDEQGGIAADKFAFEVGGQVLYRSDWLTITRINRSGAAVTSVSVANNTWPTKVDVERIRDYRAPTAEKAAAVKAATKLAPICNYPTANCATMTQAEWDAAYKGSKGTSEIKATETAARHRVRYVPSYVARKHGWTPPEGAERTHGFGYSFVQVFISDAKRKDPPQPEGEPAPRPVLAKEADLPSLEKRDEEARARQEAAAQPDPEAEKFRALKETAKAGVAVVAAPQLFPTPDDVCRQVMDLAGTMAGETILEPSAGTGNLVRAAINRATGADCCRITAVEINPQLAASLEHDRNLRIGANESNYRVLCRDFLECTPEELGTFSRIVMNPPFERGADIRHIDHARRFLKPNGRLVAVCANGPRQRERLQPTAAQWVDLPAGSFKDQGTMVNAAIYVYDAPQAAPETEAEQPTTEPARPSLVERTARAVGQLMLF